MDRRREVRFFATERAISAAVANMSRLGIGNHEYYRRALDAYNKQVDNQFSPAVQGEQDFEGWVKTSLKGVMGASVTDGHVHRDLAVSALDALVDRSPGMVEAGGFSSIDELKAAMHDDLDTVIAHYRLTVV